MTRSDELKARDSSKTSSLKLKDSPLRGGQRTWIAGNTQWIVKNWNWSKLKPVIRCTVVAWVSVVVFVIPRVEAFLGQASFLILVAAFLAPPHDSFISVLEKSILILLFVSMAWAWSCLGIFLANLARRVHNPAATIFEVVDGRYIEAAPTVILGVFVFLGSAFFLYIKARQGAGPYLFACIFACICLDISLTTVVLFPFPFYLVGKAIILPLAFAFALSLLGSIFIFPTTISEQFTSRLQDVLTPLISALDLYRTLLNTPFPTDSDSTFSSMDVSKYTEQVTAAWTSIKASEAALGALSASARLLKNDLTYSRFSPVDFQPLQLKCRQISGAANGLAAFFALSGIGPGADTGIGADKCHADTPVHTVPNSPAAGPSRRTSFTEDDNRKLNIPTTPPSSPYHSIRSHPKTPCSSLSPKHLHHDHSHSSAPLHNSLLSFSRPSYEKPSRGHETEHAVGTFESQRYLNLEATRLWDPNWEEWTKKSIRALGESCDPVLEVCRDSLTAVNVWLRDLRHDKITYLLGIRRKERDERIAKKVKEMKELRAKISDVLESFRSDKRLLILDPYRPESKTSTSQSLKPKSEVQYLNVDTADARFEHKPLDADEEHQMPHRYLFRSYFYQHHLIRVCSIIIEMLDEIIKLEEKRTHDRWWTPVGKIFTWNKTLFPEDADNMEDDDPDVIQGLQHNIEDEDEDDDKSSISEDLGVARVRDPDALPPRNSTEWVMAHVYSFIVGFGGGNAIFAVKAGLLTVLLCLPLFLKSSAGFAYDNKFVWGVIMGQTTLSRFRGETSFGLVARILSTLFGALTGLVMWYVSGGGSKRDDFGLAAVCGVCFPIFFFSWLYAPVSPVSNTLYFVTIALIIGYSYQDEHLFLPGSPGFGWTIAWRRLVLVIVGVVAAFLASYLPPSTTIRRYHRNLLSTTAAQLGATYCAILSFGSTKAEPEIQEILGSLLAIRSKLNRSVMIRTNIDYEFSLRGRWPKERYHKIVELQVGISYSLASLVSVLQHLEPPWARALLRRTRFMDPDFQGDFLAVISMIATSLRTGSPLPQITPCPLLDRFLLKYHGLNVIHEEAGEDYGLPRSMTFDTLKNEQYLIFSVGLTTAFRLVNRLDRLMLATKEVVGEHYHIHGIGGASSVNPILKESSRPITPQFQPPGDDIV